MTLVTIAGYGYELGPTGYAVRQVPTERPASDPEYRTQSLIVFDQPVDEAWFDAFLVRVRRARLLKYATRTATIMLAAIAAGAAAQALVSGEAFPPDALVPALWVLGIGLLLSPVLLLMEHSPSDRTIGRRSVRVDAFSAPGRDASIAELQDLFEGIVLEDVRALFLIDSQIDRASQEDLGTYQRLSDERDVLVSAIAKRRSTRVRSEGDQEREYWEELEASVAWRLSQAGEAAS